MALIIGKILDSTQKYKKEEEEKKSSRPWKLNYANAP